VPDISATDASRRFADLLDAVEHRGERFVIRRHGRVIARLEPARAASGAELKAYLARHRADPAWAGELAELRGLLEVEDRS
jgi:prevent-host-death family protein